jgi:hypothetical protein
MPDEESTSVEVSADWRDFFDERGKKQISFAAIYARDYHHGADGHNNMLIIAEMAKLLDTAYGLDPPAVSAR